MSFNLWFEEAEVQGDSDIIDGCRYFLDAAEMICLLGSFVTNINFHE